MTKQDILAKAKKKTAIEGFILTCLFAEVCPDCGDDLEIKEVWFENHWPCRPHKKYKCNSCKFNYKHSV